MSDVSTTPAAPLEPFKGGGKLMLGAGAIGVIGLALTFVGIAMNPERAYASYLLGFVYWVGIALASLFMVAIFNTAAAQWMTVIRRQMEQHASGLVILAVLFVPIVFGMKHLYVWADEDVLHKMSEPRPAHPAPEAPVAERERLHHSRRHLLRGVDRRVVSHQPQQPGARRQGA